MPMTTVPAVTADDLDPRIARSRAKLLAAATDLLVEAGPRAVTVDAVAERSGVAKSTLYRHWSSRDDLLVAVMRSHVPQLPEVDLSVGFEAALRQLMASVVDVFSDPEWVRILPALFSLQHQVPELAEVLIADREASSAALREIIACGVREGRLPRRIDHQMVRDTLIGPLFVAVLSGDSAPLGDLATYVVDRFLASYR